mmetsp:Transcript_783/g.1678  ORF Transcript_783/g.1678 Transcript_783/m.1678 type:complete len:428 (-) Transcript_783:118-1401(-)
MIWYDQRQICIVLRKLPVVLKDRHIWRATLMALPAAAVACYIESEEARLGRPWWRGTFMQKAVYNGLSFLACYMVFLRMKRSYKRFFDGCEKAYAVCGDWYDAMSLVVAFTRHAKADKDEIEKFHHLLFRIMSLLLGFVFADLQKNYASGHEEESMQAMIDKWPVLDIPGVDQESLDFLAAMDDRVEVSFNWVQSLLVDKMRQGVLNVPPPILTRVFQELGDGMIKYHEALHICRVPFPFPLAVTTECLLFLIMVVTPLGIVSWTDYTTCATVFSFLFVFILWYFNGIATAIENPFAGNIHTLPTIKMQAEQNLKMLILLTPEACQVPQVTEEALWDDTRVFEKELVYDWKTWSMGKSPSRAAGDASPRSVSSVEKMRGATAVGEANGAGSPAHKNGAALTELEAARAKHGDSIVMEEGDPEPMVFL